MATFGERLKKLRTEKKLTQQELATTLNVNKSSISRYEKEQQIAEIQLLEKIADYFNVTLDYLLGRSETRINKEILDKLDSFNNIDYVASHIINSANKSIISSNISFLRNILLRMSLEEFSESLDIKTEDVDLIEKGKLIPKEELINKICEVYMVEKSWLKNNDTMPFTFSEMISIPEPIDDEMMKIFSQLSDEDKETIKKVMQALASHEKDNQ